MTEETTSPDLTKIIARVRKLFDLAGNNANENEALSALEKAHTLLAEHNLSMAEIEKSRSNGREKRHMERTKTNLSERYFIQIFDKVAKLYFCTALYSRPNKFKRETYYTLIGREVNVILATEMALYLTQTMKRLCNDAVKASGDRSNKFRDSFLKGMTNRLWQRITDMEKRAPVGNTANALVLFVDEEVAANKAFMDEMYGEGTIKEAKSRPTAVKDPAAYYKGRDAANTVNFDRQVKHDKKLQIGN